MTLVLTKRGNWDTDVDKKEDDVQTQGEGGRLQAKERGLGRLLPSQPSEGTTLP